MAALFAASLVIATACDGGGATPPQQPGPGTVVWVTLTGDASSQSAEAVAAGPGGTALVAGLFSGSIDLGGGVLTSAGSTDVFLAKFAPDGSHLWSRRFGDSSAQAVGGLAVDSNGSVLLAGSFAGTIDFGGGPLTSAGGTDVFVAKLDSYGSHLWSRRFGDASDQVMRAVTVDGSGNVFVAGDFEGSLDLGGGPLTSAGGTDVFVAKLDPYGVPIWSRRYGDGGAQAATGLAVDTSGNVFLTGSFEGTVDFGGGAVTSAGGTDLFVVKLSSTGAPLWSKVAGDAASQQGPRLAVGSDGAVALAGSLVGTVELGGAPLTSAGGSDVLVAKLSADGGHLWSKRFGDAADQQALGVSLGSDGAVTVGGSFAGSMSFGGPALTSAGGLDLFVARLDGSGARVWDFSVGGAGDQDLRGVALSSGGDVLVAGAQAGTINILGAAITSAGSTDVMVFALRP